MLQYLPRPLLTVDQVRQLKVDNVVSEAAIREGRTLAGLGIDADQPRGDAADPISTASARTASSTGRRPA